MTEATPFSAPDAAQVHTSRLRDHPNWVYLLKEFHDIYSLGSAGGSKPIRSHRRKVRDALSQVLQSNPEVTPRQPVLKPVVAHLPRAFDLATRGTMAGISRAMERASTELTWEYGYERVPPHLVGKYAYCEILGPRGPVTSDKLTLGVVLFAPRPTYPQHSPRAIQES